MAMGDEERTRIFLSAGGNSQEEYRELDEEHLTDELKDKLEKLEINGRKYEVYFALPDQSVEGVVDGIFENLKNSEYYLFIDFKREPLLNSKKEEMSPRGSLFTNQELAVAKVQKMHIIAFQEEGIKQKDGILGFIKVNATPFVRNELVDKVMERVRKEWTPGWKNKLVLGRNPSEKGSAEYQLRDQEKRPATFFHISVNNRHLSKLARGCLAYIEKVTDLNSKKDLTPLKLLELKWEGVTTPRVPIPPQSTRGFDGFYIFQDEPNFAYLGINPFIVDYSEFVLGMKLEAPGKYEITFVVYSDDFSPSRESFVLDMDGKLDNVKFYKSGTPPPSPATDMSMGQPTSLSQIVVTGSGTTMVAMAYLPNIPLANDD